MLAASPMWATIADSDRYSDLGGVDVGNHNGAPDVNGPEPDLKRVMGPTLLLLFIVGDILGAGHLRRHRRVALEVGGIVWLPFLVAFAVATLTALSYLELVTNHPQAAGAALYTHKAFGVHFVTFLVAFGVICSGITSASTSSNLLATNLLAGLRRDRRLGAGRHGHGARRRAAFMVLLALINLRGVGESVKFNVRAHPDRDRGAGHRDRRRVLRDGPGRRRPGPGRGVQLRQRRGMFAAVTVATAIAFFAMVGFEDSVNMVEETKDPSGSSRRMMLTGLGIAVICYILVAVSVIAVIPEGRIESVVADEGKVLLEVVTIGAPGFPIDKVFPFLTVLRGRQHRADQHADGQPLLYGMANQDVLPRRSARCSRAVVRRGRASSSPPCCRWA